MEPEPKFLESLRKLSDETLAEVSAEIMEKEVRGPDEEEWLNALMTVMKERWH